MLKLTINVGRSVVDAMRWRNQSEATPRILVSTLFVDLKINKKLKQILMFKTINNDNNDMA